jgi:hypothetical protein
MKEERTDYSFSNDYLMFKVGDVVGYMNRDVTEFTARNITQTDIDDFEAQGNAFEDMLPDSYYQSLITIEVEAKNTARDNCQKQARKIAGYVEQAYGDKSGQYKSLNYGKLYGSKDRSFITGARLVARAAENLLASVSTYGLTQQMIDDLIAEAQIMEDKVHMINQRESERDIQTHDRIIAGNALYAKLVQYCTVGKAIWEDVNEAKYNDYIINPSVNHGLSKVQNLVAGVDPASPNEAVLTWEPVTEATEYEIYQSQVTAGNPPEEYEINQTTPNVTEAIPIVAGFTYYWKVRGKSATKIGYFSDSVSLTV